MQGAGGGRVGLGGAVGCGPKFFGSVRYGSGRFDTILGESIVETAMFKRLRISSCFRLNDPTLTLNPPHPKP